MRKLTILVTAAAGLASAALTPALAQEVRPGPHSPANLPLALPSPIFWFFDGRDDTRDFPNNGSIPAILPPIPPARGSAPPACSASTRSTPPTPRRGRLVAGSPHDQSWCARHHRSYDPGSGTFVGKNGTRYRCG